MSNPASRPRPNLRCAHCGDAVTIHRNLVLHARGHCTEPAKGESQTDLDRETDLLLQLGADWIKNRSHITARHMHEWGVDSWQILWAERFGKGTTDWISDHTVEQIRRTLAARGVYPL